LADTPQKMELIIASADSLGGKSGMKKAKAEAKSEKKASKKAMEGKYEAEVRNEKNHIVKLETNYGDLVLELYHDLAPNHADSFFARVEDHFYEGTIFHRVISGFMIQGGDPTGTGMGDPKRPGYTLNAEFSKEKHKRGILSMARSNDVNSASSQFFICHKDALFLDTKYTAFGNLLQGYDTLDKIAAVKKGANDRPLEEVKILKTTVIK
jgi:cyclophilin family peptidyl-prolyl cis-trans isomerase